MLVAEAGVEPAQFKLMRLARCRFSTLPKVADGLGGKTVCSGEKQNVRSRQVFGRTQAAVRTRRHCFSRLILW